MMRSTHDAAFLGKGDLRGGNPTYKEAASPGAIFIHPKMNRFEEEALEI